MPQPGPFGKRTAYFVYIVLFTLLLACAGVQTVVVEPAPSEETLLNPGRGFATTHLFNDGLAGRLHPLCTVAQFRWYWDELEPVEGQINFRMIDSLLAQGHANGQRLNFRVMCQDGVMHVPDWVRKAGAKGEKYQDDPKNWQPHYSDPVFLEKHARFIAALAARYDGHPDVDCVDIGSVGRWGEWHTGGTGMEMPDDSTQKRIINMYLDSFHKTPLIMLIGGGFGLLYAVENGAGWRADCLGDMGGFSDTWNHMHDFYPQALANAKAEEVWKHAPVIFETCWTMQYWYDKGWDVDSILTAALDWHVSILNNGSEAVPEAWWPKVQQFEKKMGYRFRLVRLRHPNRLRPGGTFMFDMDWENQGVAPCYLRHSLALRLRNTETGGTWEVPTDVDITKWLPGPVPLQSSVVLPGDMPSGEYEIALALLDPYSGKPAIRLANAGRDEDGWYTLSRIRLR